MNSSGQEMSGVSRPVYSGIPIFAAKGVHEHVARLLSSRLTRGGSVLELGCGAGALTQRLVDMGYRVMPVDIDASRNKSSAAVITQDLNEPSWQGIRDSADSSSGKFDAIVAVEVIEHVENPALFVRTASAHLKEGGVLIVSTPNIVSPYSALVLLCRRHLYCFNESLIMTTGHVSMVPWWILSHYIAKADFNLNHHITVGRHDAGIVHSIGERALRLFMRVFGRSREDETFDDGIVTLMVATKGKSLRA